MTEKQQNQALKQHKTEALADFLPVLDRIYQNQIDALQKENLELSAKVKKLEGQIHCLFIKCSRMR
jgi:phage shock protein A